MSKSEKIKEQIGWLKVIFGLLTAVGVSLVGYIANSYSKSDFIMLALAIITLLFVSISIVVVNKKAFKKMDELEEL